MAAEPFGQYLELLGDITLEAPHTACWRGYVGRWEIRDGRLLLLGITAFLSGRTEVNLDYFFPGKHEIFAGWFTGEIRVPQGELLDYVHGGYHSLYESDIFLGFEKGILTRRSEVDNQEEFRRRLEEYKDLPF